MNESQNQAGLTGALAVIGATPGALSLFKGGEAGGIELPKPFSNKILLLEGICIAGTTHAKGIDEIARTVAVDDELTLVREADNYHDEWCVEVLSPSGEHMGYLPCDKNEVIARLMDGGKRVYAVVTDKQVLSGWNRIGIEVYLDD